MTIRFFITSFLIFFISTYSAYAQESSEEDKYWVFLTDKNESQFDPHSYFDQKAIDRRNKLGISLDHISDYPVSPSYVSRVGSIVNSVKTQTRWFNALVVMASPEQVEALGKLAFVRDIQKSRNSQVSLSGLDYSSGINAFEMNSSQAHLAAAQVERMQASEFANAGLTGKDIRIAIFDVGFKSYKTNPAVEHLHKGKQIIATWDFVKKRKNVDAGGSHGMNVLSCIAGKYGDQIIGLAQDAEFLLARTETWTEFFSEEENWLAAAEWADKNGADIINSSLGYTYHRYFRYNMDGQTAFISKVANMAAKKGILVVNSVGNEGDNSWKNMGAPADADSVLSVGGIHFRSGVHTSFSSFGPTWDKRLKPNVTAYGHVIASGPKGYTQTQGTSFSSPLVAGFAACAWQSDTSLTNMELFMAIQQSADLYPYFDYAHGYGVPQASWFIGNKKTNNEKTRLSIVEQGNLLRIVIDDSTGQGQNDESRSYKYLHVPNHLFYHVENKSGYLSKYYVVRLNPNTIKGVVRDPLTIDKNEYELPFTIRAFYKGEVVEYHIKKD
jgi:serine protease AprX